MTIAISLLFLGAAIVALGSLIDSASRVPGLLRQLEEDRRSLADVTPYTGPTFNRHGHQLGR